MTQKPVVATHQSVTIDAYTIIARAVSEGTQRGITKAHKHNAAPDREVITEHIEREVMQALTDVLKF